MIEEDPNNMAADPTAGEDRGLSVLDQQDDNPEVLPKLQRSPLEEAIMRETLGFEKFHIRQENARWHDRNQTGPSPADFGEHQPIPIDAVCLSPVLATDDAVVDEVPETVEELEQDLKTGRRTSNG
jgi:hypothetical protein